MRKLLVLPTLGVCAFGLLIAVSQRANARPGYHAELLAMYGEYTGTDAAQKKAAEDFKKLATEKRCNVCHSEAAPMNKKLQSEFALAFKEELAKAAKAKDPATTTLTNIRDVEIIKAALTKIADAKPKEPKDGTETYGKMIKAGKLPPAYKAPEEAKPVEVKPADPKPTTP